MSKTQRTSSARQRILETADSLFYSEGIRSVGMDRVIAEIANAADIVEEAAKVLIAKAKRGSLFYLPQYIQTCLYY